MPEIKSHIPLQGACNTRDLGGYPLEDGRATARYAFIRCETPFKMTPADIDTLLSLGVGGVIDLRNQSEIEREPNPFATNARVKYWNIPLFAGAIGPHQFEKLTMGDLYVHMLDNAQPGFAQVFRAALETRGSVLFHCSAGKDRTGLVAALLLLNAGVDRGVVVQEYCYTQVLLRPWVENQLRQASRAGMNLSARMLDADEEYIAKAIDHIGSVYGSARGYLLAIGLAEGEVEALKRRVIDGATPV